MIASKRVVTVREPGRVVLSDLPFQAGQRVEIVLIAEEGTRETAAEELRRLFKGTQALPQAWAITEEEISEDVASYRAGR
jgi:hypothetical protein